MKAIIIRLLLLPLLIVLGSIFFTPQIYAFNLMTDAQIDELYQDCLERANAVTQSANLTPDDQENQQKAIEDCEIIRQAYVADRDYSTSVQSAQESIVRQLFSPIDSISSTGINATAEEAVDEFCNTYSQAYPTIEPNKTFSPGQIKENCVQHHADLLKEGTLPVKKYYTDQQIVEFYDTCRETADAYLEEVATTMTEDEKYAYRQNAYTNCQCYYEFILQGGDISDKDISRPLREQILPMVDFKLPDICYLGKYQVVSAGGAVGGSGGGPSGSSSSSSSSSSGSNFTSIDIGNEVNSGNTVFEDGTFNITVASGALGANTDDFRFVYQQISGDVTITARVVSISSANRWARAGVHIRDNLNDDSMNASMFITPEKRLAQFRPTNGGVTQYFYDDDSPVKWLRLQRTGNTVNAYYSSDGSNFVLYKNFTVNLGTTVYAGLGVTSDDPSTPSTATIDNVSITSP